MTSGKPSVTLPENKQISFSREKDEACADKHDNENKGACKGIIMAHQRLLCCRADIFSKLFCAQVLGLPPRVATFDARPDLPEGNLIDTRLKIHCMAKKIVLAEDDADIRFILNLVLNEAGYEVEPLPSGNAIVEGRKEWPDLFILDKSLPTIDGLAICKYLKIQQQTKDIPIIMITSYHKLKSKAEEVGVDNFIEKPFDLKELLHVIERTLDNRAQLRQAGAS